MRRLPLPAQHHQVAHVVRHLVRQHRQRGDHAQAQVGHEGRGDQDAVAETMHAVTGEYGPAARLVGMGMGMGMAIVGRGVPVGMRVALRVLMGVVMRRRGRHLVVVFVPVVPQLGLVQQEEEHQPHQQGEEQVVRAGLALERLGQQVQEGGGQQGACGQAQHVLGVARQCAKSSGPRQSTRCRCRRPGCRSRLLPIT
jgi:hypothetical protein